MYKVLKNGFIVHILYFVHVPYAKVTFQRLFYLHKSDLFKLREIWKLKLGAKKLGFVTNNVLLSVNNMSFIIDLARGCRSVACLTTSGQGTFLSSFYFFSS